MQVKKITEHFGKVKEEIFKAVPFGEKGFDLPQSRTFLPIENIGQTFVVAACKTVKWELIND